jgi:hypothetical protein
VAGIADRGSTDRNLASKDERLDARARERRGLGCNLGRKNTIQSRSGVDVRDDDLPNVLILAHSGSCQLLRLTHEPRITRHLPTRGSSLKLKLVS